MGHSSGVGLPLREKHYTWEVKLTYHSVSQVAVVGASILITFGLYDQSLKIWRTKSARDFTTSIILAILINEVAWLNYGLSIKEWPLILIPLLNIPAVLIATVGYFRFRK